MASNDNRKIGYRIMLGVVVVLLGGSMLLYLVPTTPGTTEISTDALAKVGDQSVTVAEVRQQLDEMERRNQIPKQFEVFAAQQVLKQLVYQKEIEYESKRLGITVSDQERADRIRQFLPTAFNVFMNVDVTGEGRLVIKPPRSRAGDSVVLRAEMDLRVALSACPAATCNGGGATRPLAFEVLD